MATQLTRRNWRAALSSTGPSISIQPRYAVAGAVICIALVYAAMFASMRTGNSERASAETRYLDATQLLTVPPVPVATLEAELATAQSALASVQLAASGPSIDPASDEATALLVRRAQDAALSVASVARLNSTQTQLDAAKYNVDALRMTVRGGSQDAVIAFLRALQTTDPGLVPALTSLTVEDGGVSAEILFSVYTKIEPTPVAGAPGAAP